MCIYIEREIYRLCVHMYVCMYVCGCMYVCVCVWYNDVKLRGFVSAVSEREFC